MNGRVKGVKLEICTRTNHVKSTGICEVTHLLLVFHYKTLLKFHYKNIGICEVTHLLLTFLYKKKQILLTFHY